MVCQFFFVRHWGYVNCTRYEPQCADLESDQISKRVGTATCHMFGIQMHLLRVMADMPGLSCPGAGWLSRRFPL